MPKHIVRLIILIVAFVAVFIGAKVYFTLESFGIYGHDHADSVTSATASRLNSSVYFRLVLFSIVIVHLSGPLLFLTSAYVSGVGLLILSVWLRNFLVTAKARVSPELLTDMARLMLYGIFFDLFLLGNEFLELNYGTAEERAILYEVLLGVFRWPYLYLEIVWGLVLPLIILVIPKLNRLPTGVFAAAFMTATGVYGMRIWWVMAAQYYQGHF